MLCGMRPGISPKRPHILLSVLLCSIHCFFFDYSLNMAALNAVLHMICVAMTIQLPILQFIRAEYALFPSLITTTIASLMYPRKAHWLWSILAQIGCYLKERWSGHGCELYFISVGDLPLCFFWQEKVYDPTGANPKLSLPGSGEDYMSRDKVKQMLITNNILPIFCVTDTSATPANETYLWEVRKEGARCIRDYITIAFLIYVVAIPRFFRVWRSICVGSR